MNLGKTDDVANIILGDKWRMPTPAEFNKMREATYWAWNATDCGYYVFMPDLGTSGAANGRGTFNTSTDDKSKALLFFPAAGCGQSTNFSNVSNNGYFWSSSLYTSNAYACRMYFLANGNVYPQSNIERFYGLSVRPVSD